MCLFPSDSVRHAIALAAVRLLRTSVQSKQTVSVLHIRLIFCPVRTWAGSYNVRSGSPFFLRSLRLSCHSQTLKRQHASLSHTLQTLCANIAIMETIDPNLLTLPLGPPAWAYQNTLESTPSLISAYGYQHDPQYTQAPNGATDGVGVAKQTEHNPGTVAL
jgi:hypothetical protein